MYPYFNNIDLGPMSTLTYLCLDFSLEYETVRQQVENFQVYQYLENAYNMEKLVLSKGKKEVDYCSKMMNCIQQKKWDLTMLRPAKKFESVQANMERELMSNFQSKSPVKFLLDQNNLPFLLRRVQY